MVIGIVYRAANRNAHGDPVDADGKVVRLASDRIGTIAGLIPGEESVSALVTRGDVASTAGLIGAPTDAAVLLQHGDVLEINGARYAISGLRLWGHANSFTGTLPSHYWIKATATTN